MILRCIIGLCLVFILGYSSSTLRQYVDDTTETSRSAHSELENAIAGRADSDEQPAILSAATQAPPEGVDASGEIAQATLATSEPASAVEARPSLRPLEARVLDAQTGRPIAGVRVEREGNLLCETDERGLFGLEVQFDASYALSLRNDEYALAYFYVDEPVRARDEYLVIHLQRSASLEALVKDDAGRPVPGVQVVLSTRAAELEQSRVRVARDRIRPPNPRWEALTDPLGRVHFSGLPSEVPLQVAIWEEGHGVRDLDTPVVRASSGVSTWERPEGCLFSTERALFLRQQEVRSVEWSIPGLAPAVDVHNLALVQPEARPGTAALADVAPPTTTLRVDHAAGGAALGDLADAARQAISISGTLRAENGQGLAGIVLAAQSEANSASAPRATTAADGSFSLVRLAAGEYELVAYGGARYGTRSLGVFARGEHGLELVLESGNSLSGVVVDAESKLPQPALLSLFAASEMASRIAAVQADADGAFKFQDLRPGRYHLLASSPTGKVALLRNVELGPNPPLRPLELCLESGARLRVQCNSGRTIKRLVVEQEGAGIGAIELRNRYEERLLVPAGELRLRLYAGGELYAERRLRIAAGAEELVLWD